MAQLSSSVGAVATTGRTLLKDRLPARVAHLVGTPPTIASLFIHFSRQSTRDADIRDRPQGESARMERGRGYRARMAATRWGAKQSARLAPLAGTVLTRLYHRPSVEKAHILQQDQSSA
jgi:hypothetical protein